MRDYDRKVQFWRRRQRTFPAQHPMTALGLVAALWIAPVYAQEVVNCSSLKVTNNLVEKIDTSIQATGWPARMANVVTVSDEGIRLEIELRRSWVDSRSTKRPNTSVMGVPANLVSSESPPALLFAARGIIGTGVMGWVTGDWSKSDDNHFGSTSREGRTRSRSGTSAFITYPGGPWKSKDMTLHLSCREYIYADANATLEQSNVFELLIAIAKKDAEHD